jgi:hypothetical protein
VKFRKLLLMTSLVLMVQSAQADVRIQMSPTLGKVKQDSCAQFVGTWKGTAQVETFCKYDGNVLVSQGSAANRFNLHVALTPQSFLCPNSDPVDLSGTCNESSIVIDTPNSVHLNGNTDGHKVHVSGTVVSSGKTIHVDSLDLVKQ